MSTEREVGEVAQQPGAGEANEQVQRLSETKKGGWESRSKRMGRQEEGKEEGGGCAAIDMCAVCTRILNTLEKMAL